jgi:hypothetical protein
METHGGVEKTAKSLKRNGKTTSKVIFLEKTEKLKTFWRKTLDIGRGRWYDNQGIPRGNTMR